MTSDQAKKIIETLLFVSDKPLSLGRIKEVLADFEGEITGLIEELKDEYHRSQRAFTVEEVGGGYRLSTDPFYGPWIRKLFKANRKDRLTMPSLETLSIVAYKQPLTKAEIEAIRGVNIDAVLKTLLERDLIKITGRKEVAGRPFFYGTTREFLIRFGLNSLDDLPKLREFAEDEIEMGKKQLVQMEKSRSADYKEDTDAGELTEVSRRGAGEDQTQGEKDDAKEIAKEDR